MESDGKIEKGNKIIGYTDQTHRKDIENRSNNSQKTDDRLKELISGYIKENHVEIDPDNIDLNKLYKNLYNEEPKSNDIQQESNRNDDEESILVKHMDKRGDVISAVDCGVRGQDESALTFSCQQCQLELEFNYQKMSSK